MGGYDDSSGRVVVCAAQTESCAIGSFLIFPFFSCFFFSVPVFACIADLANEKRIVQYEDALVFDLNTFVLQDSWTSFTKELLAKSRAVM